MQPKNDLHSKMGEGHSLYIVIVPDTNLSNSYQILVCYFSILDYLWYRLSTCGHW